MRQKRKNNFFTFIFSLLPGAAEMYMGFMKNGFTLMIIFFLSFVPSVFFSVLDFLGAIGVVLWFFGFFHARNYASMTDAEFAAMQDKYIWEEFDELKGMKFANTTVKKAVAVVLILIGAGQLWNYFSGLIYNLIPENLWDAIYPVVREIPQLVIAVLFVVAGIYMIMGKKKELDIAPNVEIMRIGDISPKQESQRKETENKETADKEIENTASNVKESEIVETKEA